MASNAHPSHARSLATALAVMLSGVGIYHWHASAFAGWIVDDAGITFSYARSLVLGYGLVAQPGLEPVEGFTSLSWCLLQMPFLALRVFDPVATPKLLASACVTIAFAAVGWWLVRSRGMRPLVAASALATTALFPGFVMWCASGLENALYCALLACLLAATTVAVSRPGLGGALAGVLVFLVFCTRPDGLLYLWLPPFLAGAAIEAPALGSHRRGFLAGFAVPWLAVTSCRLLYFQDVLPNTFYAKKAEGSKQVAAILDGAGIWAGGAIIMALGLVGALACAVLFQRLGSRIGSRLPLPALAPAFFLATSVIVYLALPGDWMPEYRFATPAFLFLPAAVLGLAGAAFGRSDHSRAVPVGLVTVAALGLTALYAWKRTPELASNPIIPFEDVRALAIRVAAETDAAGLETSVLTPDIGGALWEDRFRVLDLAGLVDRDLARRRTWESRREYILTELQPDAVLLHTYWMSRAGFLEDPAFTSAYVQAWSPEGAATGLWVRRAPQQPSGGRPGVNGERR